MARGQCGDLRHGGCRRRHRCSGDPGHFIGPGGAHIRGKYPSHAGVAAHHVSLHAGDLPYRRPHGNAQRARPLLHSCGGRAGAQPRDDRLRPVSRAAPGPGIGPADFRAGHRRADRGRGASRFPIADPAPRRLSLSMGRALARRNRARSRSENDSRRARRGGVSGECAPHQRSGFLGGPADRRVL